MPGYRGHSNPGVWPCRPQTLSRHSADVDSSQFLSPFVESLPSEATAVHRFESWDTPRSDKGAGHVNFIFSFNPPILYLQFAPA
jgi:hypothetical protein